MKRKKLLGILVLCINVIAVDAQRFYWAEERNEVNTVSEGNAIETDSQGNVIVLGNFFGGLYLGDVVIPEYSYGYFLAKYDSLGGLIWVTPILSSTYLSVNMNQVGLTVDEEDNIYLTASFRETLTFEDGTVLTTTASVSDFFVCKFSATGALLLAFAQGADDASATDIAVDVGGAIYVTGDFSGQLLFSTQLTSSGGRDAFLVKYDATGIPVWELMRGSTTHNDIGFGVATSVNEVFWGYNYAAGTAPNKTYFTYLTKLNASTGATHWFFYGNSSDLGNPNSGYRLWLEDQEVFVTGGYTTGMSFRGSAVELTSSGDFQAFVFKVSDLGNTSSGFSLDWAVARGLIGYTDVGYSLRSNGNTVFLSRSSSFYGPTVELLRSEDGSFVQSAFSTHSYSDVSSAIYDLAILPSGKLFTTGEYLYAFGIAEVFITSPGVGAMVAGWQPDLTLDWITGPYTYRMEYDLVAADDEGNSYVTGRFYGRYFDDRDTLISRGGSDVFLMKYNPAGERMFITHGGSQLTDAPKAIKIKGSTLIITGTHDSGADAIPMIFGDTIFDGDERLDVFMASYSTDGTLNWARSVVEMEGDLQVGDLEIDNAGNIYLISDSEGGSTKKFGNGINLSFSQKGMFLSKYDATGMALWAKNVDQTKASSLEIDDEGNLFIGGTFAADIPFEDDFIVHAGGPGNDVFLASFDPDGNYRWVTYAGGENDDFISDLELDEAHEALYMTGGFTESFTLSDTTIAGLGRDIFLIKYDMSGAMEWITTGGGPFDDRSYDLDLDSAGQPFIVGKYEGQADFDDFTFSGLGDKDLQAILIGFNHEGLATYGKEFGAPTDCFECTDEEYFNSLDITPENDFFILGQFVDSLLIDTVWVSVNNNATQFLANGALSDCAFIGNVGFYGVGDPCEGEMMQFTDTTNLIGHAITGWLWDFGDGETSTAQHPIKSYETPGTYPVSLTVSYEGECTASISREMSFIEANEVLAGEDGEICEGESIDLEGLLAGNTNAVLWSTLGDGSFNDSSAPATQYEPGPGDIQNGQVSFIISSDEELCEVARDTVQWLINPLPVTSDTSVVVTSSDTLRFSFLDSILLASGYELAIVYSPQHGEVLQDPGTIRYLPEVESTYEDSVIYHIGTWCGFAVGKIAVSNFFPCTFIVDAGTDTLSCPGEWIPLNGSCSDPDVPILWHSLGDGSFENDTLLHTTYFPGVLDLEAGYVQVVLSAANAYCQSVDSVSRDTLQISIHPQPEADDIAVEVVTGESYILELLDSAGIAHGYELAIVSGPEHGSLTVTTQTIEYSTQNNFEFVDSILYEIRSDCGIAIGTVRLPHSDSCIPLPDVLDTVIEVGDADHVLVELLDSQQMVQGLEVWIITEPLYGDFILVDGIIEYWATTDFGFEDSIRYEIHSNCGIAAGTVRLSHSDSCIPLPEVHDTVIEVSNAEHVLVELLDSQSVAQGLEAQVISGPLYGDFTLTGGIIDYWTDSGFEDSIQYEIHSNCGFSAGTLVFVPVTSCTLTISAGEDITVCGQDLVSLSGISNDSEAIATWRTSGDGSFSDATIVQTTYFPGPGDRLAGEVLLSLFTENAYCEVSDTLRVTLQPQALLRNDELLEDSVTVCSNDRLSLAARTEESPLWTTQGDGWFSDHAGEAVTYSFGQEDIEAGEVVISVITETSCVIQVDTMRAFLIPPPTIEDYIADIGLGESVQVDLYPLISAHIAPYTASLEPGVTKGTCVLLANSLRYTAPAVAPAGGDTLSYQVVDGCDQEMIGTAVFRFVDESPLIDFDPIPITMGALLTVDLLSGIIDNNQNLDLSTLRADSLTRHAGVPVILENQQIKLDYVNRKFTGTDQLKLWVCDSAGNCSEGEIQLLVEPLEIQVYNAVSPNGDGKHDFLKIEHIDRYSDNQLTIFDRTGQVVYQAKNYDNSFHRFTGLTGRGQELEEGSYYYILDVYSLGIKLSGFILLSR